MLMLHARQYSDSSQTPQIIIWWCISWYDFRLHQVLYSYRQKAGISFEITNEKIRLFSSMLLLSGFHKLLDRKMYWEETPDTFV